MFSENHLVVNFLEYMVNVWVPVRLETAPTEFRENWNYRFKYLIFMKPHLRELWNRSLVPVQEGINI